MKRILPIAGAALMVCGATTSIQAASINYELTGNTYSYTVNNNSLGNSLTDFIIYFPDVGGNTGINYTDYTLGAATGPSGWTFDVYQPSSITLGGFVEWYTTGIGIDVNGSLSGFSATFSHTGTGTDTPASQYFEVYANIIDPVDSGYTTSGVPEPSTWFPEVIAVAFLASIGRSRLFAKQN